MTEPYQRQYDLRKNGGGEDGHSDHAETDEEGDRGQEGHFGSEGHLSFLGEALYMVLIKFRGEKPGVQSVGTFAEADCGQQNQGRGRHHW